jgi:HK97 family phage portal protein
MGFLDWFRQPAAARPARTMPAAETGFLSLDDPRVIEFLRFGDISATGITVNVERAMKNTSMFRAVSLISNAIGMLPLQMIDVRTKEKAIDHPAYRVLHRRPNSWQSAFDFRSLMQQRALTKGDAYALIVRSPDIRRRGRLVITQLIPVDPDRTTVRQLDDLSVVYRYQPLKGGAREYKARDVFHLRGMSFNGLNGISVVKQAAEAIGLALAAELAAGRLFKNGTFVGGALTHPGKLSDPAFERLKSSLAEKEGAENAGKNLILEEGMKYETYSTSARDAQLTDIRKMQVEEIGRATGIPRPLLMVDDTSWGSGIEALGGFFVQYGLSPWFTAWEQAVERSVLEDDEADLYAAKFNAGALLRGSMKDQAEFFAKALGAGGSRAWMSQDEVRDLSDLPARGGAADELGMGMTAAPTPAAEDDPKPLPASRGRKQNGDDDNEDA